MCGLYRPYWYPLTNSCARYPLGAAVGVESTKEIETSRPAGILRGTTLRKKRTVAPVKLNADEADVAEFSDVQALSSKPGRCQPMRSAKRPSSLKTPRMGSRFDSPPAVPARRQWVNSGGGDEVSLERRRASRMPRGLRAPVVWS